MSTFLRTDPFDPFNINKTGQQLANVPSWGSASSRSLLNRLFLKNTLVGPPMSDPLVIL